MENVNLYATKYEEEFQPHLPNFATAVWDLLKASGTHCASKAGDKTVWLDRRASLSTPSLP